MHSADQDAQRSPAGSASARPDVPPGGQDSTGTVGAHRTFWQRAALRPSRVGAVAPSSARLASVLAAPVPRIGSPTTVEFAPGTGSVSDEIAKRVSASTRYLAIEIDPLMATWLKAARMTSMSSKEMRLTSRRSSGPGGLATADVIVSGLPWSLFDAASQAGMLSAVSRVLAPTGCFTTFAYTTGLWLSGARRFSGMLRETFDEVITTAPVWRNLPPAVVYVCRRPWPAGGTGA